MDEEHLIVQRVYDAKNNMEAADLLITDYLPFIRAQVVKIMKRPLNDKQDDELSIAMIAFHEAINSYSRNRGSFLNYSAIIIRNRIIDFWRQNNAHNQVISLASPGKNEYSTIEDHLASNENQEEEFIIRQVTKQEILKLSSQMKMFNISLTDVSDSSPKQDRTLQACQKVVAYAKDDEKIMDFFFNTQKLPLKKLVKGTGVSKKTIERHRRYIVALLLIYSNGYEIIRGHLSEVMKRGTDK